MFGTLRPVNNKITPEEKDFYKMYYCGLCSSLSRTGGTVLRMGLSYDAALMYMLLDLGNEQEAIKKFCPGRPLKKKSCVDNRELSDYVAMVSLVLIYGKCIDNINDNEKVMRSKAVLHIVKKRISAIKDASAAVLNMTENNLAEINALEKNYDGTSFLDIAGKFGELTGELFKAAPGIKEREAYYKLGYWLGRWVYIADAALDMQEDKKKKRFNPFFFPGNISLKDAVDKYGTEIAGELFKAHDCAVDILRLLDTPKSPDGIIHIVSTAMDATEGEIFKKQEEIKNA